MSAYSCKKNNKEWKGIHRKRKNMSCASVDLFGQESACCRGIKGGHIASPRRAGDPPFPSLWSSKQTICNWLFYRMWNLCVISNSRNSGTETRSWEIRGLASGREWTTDCWHLLEKWQPHSVLWMTQRKKKRAVSSLCKPGDILQTYRQTN